MLVALITAITLCSPAQAQRLQGLADHWVATDALLRTLPDHKTAGDRKPGKFVGIFYFTWSGHHAQKVYDITNILATGEPQKNWGPIKATHFWAQPEQGYYHSSDPWVVRRDMQMLANAGIDFIYVDVTNALLYEESAEALLTTISQMRKQGIPAPKVVFITNAASGQIINRVYDTFYKDGRHDGLWFQWDGKPLILGQKDDPKLRDELKAYYTIRYSWAWTAANKKPDHWQWIDTSPQDYGWSESPDKPEQIPVTVASHATNSIGRSYHKGKQPMVGADYLTAFTAQGLHFEEQWQRAHEVDPTVVMVTGWNEWIAMRFINKPGDRNYLPLFAGRTPFADGTTFVDAFTAEFSRDIAPMRGGHSDNYYYQMVGHIRRFKGMAPPPRRAQPRDIQIDGEFDDWQDVPANHLDPIGDTMHRDFRGTDPDTIYTNTTGRNDILSSRVVESDGHVHFMVSSADKLKHSKSKDADNRWMTLLIDTDQDKQTGWEGYDLAVNWQVVSPSQTRCAKWTDGKWKTTETIAYRAAGKDLELSVPNVLFPRKAGQGFDFKWIDNVSLQNVESLFLEGDVAPDRRFNFRY